MDAAVDIISDVGVQPIVDALGLSRATFYRRRLGPAPIRQSSAPPARALTPEERAEVLDVLHSDEYLDSSPAEVNSDLLSKGRYICSIRTMYRVLESANEVRERRDRARRPVYHKPELVATAPNQVWSWDISKLRTGKPFSYLFLYVIMDIFSRYVVGWMIAERENSSFATLLIEETYKRQGVEPGQLILHADNGPQMVSGTTAQLCAKLEIMRSHNRPYVSNDNPFSESLFGTAKQHPSFPKKFGGIDDGLTWGREFFPWYNKEHHHSGLVYLTPAEVHTGSYVDVLKKRQETLDVAYVLNPERFVKGAPQTGTLPEAVWINPPEEKKEKEILLEQADDNKEMEVIAQ